MQKNAKNIETVVSLKYPDKYPPPLQIQARANPRARCERSKFELPIKALLSICVGLSSITPILG